MLLLSIDVGIKNLGYSLIDYFDDKSFKIIKWDVISLLNDNFTCNFNCECNSKAIFFYDTHFFCNKHAKKSKFIIPHNITYNISNNIETIRNIAKQYHLDINGSKKILIQNIDNFIEKNFLKKVVYNSANKINLIDIGISISSNFNQIFNDYQIETVIIENQISPIANRMKTIQGMIAQYFIMKNIHNIHFISSTNKLKLFVEKKTNYSERKKLSIDITKNILNKNNLSSSWYDYFINFTKKDDLADSFLQAIWYMANINLIKFNL